MNGSQNYKLSMEMNYNITVLISVLLTIIGTKCMYMNINLFMFTVYSMDYWGRCCAEIFSCCASF